eukprot:302229-Pyramimonas_sp.AAC.1
MTVWGHQSTRVTSPNYVHNTLRPFYVKIDPDRTMQPDYAKQIGQSGTTYEPVQELKFESHSPTIPVTPTPT